MSVFAVVVCVRISLHFREDLRRDLLTSEESLGEVQALLDTEKASHEKTRSDLAAVSRDLQQTAERCGQLDSQLATALEQVRVRVCVCLFVYLLITSLFALPG